MDTLFRLVSLQSSDQQPSFNASRTSSSSRSSKAHHHFLHHRFQNQEEEQYKEECGNNYHLYMDEDFSSSSSSRHFHPHPSTTTATATQTPSTAATTPTASTAHVLFEPADFSLPPDLNLDFASPSSSSAAAAPGGGRWAAQLLVECARAVVSRDSQRVQQLMWMLNELASPYGDTEQKIASYFLQALFARLTSAGPRTLCTLAAAFDRTCSFDSTRRTALRFQELSPWSSFGHVAANGAILESFLDAAGGGGSQPQRLHILDLSNTFCTQWPTLLEALATRSSDDTPHLSITTVVSSASPSAAVQRVMKEIGQRMEKFARLMGVPFKFNVIHHAGDLSELDLDHLNLQEGGSASLAVNCVNALHSMSPAGHRRDVFIAALCRLQPLIVTVVEEEADLQASDGGDFGEEGVEGFLKGFRESLRFFSAYFDSLEESFPRTSNERLALERAAGRAVVDLVACPTAESVERRETAAGWSLRMRAAGFSPAAFSEDVADDVRALLRRYREGWSMRSPEETEDSGGGGAAGNFLAWKDQPVVWASAWKP